MSLWYHTWSQNNFLMSGSKVMLRYRCIFAFLFQSGLYGNVHAYWRTIRRTYIRQIFFFTYRNADTWVIFHVSPNTVAVRHQNSTNGFKKVLRSFSTTIHRGRMELGVELIDRFVPLQVPGTQFTVGSISSYCCWHSCSASFRKPMQRSMRMSIVR